MFVDNVSKPETKPTECLSDRKMFKIETCSECVIIRANDRPLDMTNNRYDYNSFIFSYEKIYHIVLHSFVFFGGFSLVNYKYFIILSSSFFLLFFPVEGTNIKQHFTFFNVERTWTEAKIICEDRGMNFLKLETIQETDYVIELITNEPGITTL